MLDVLLDPCSLARLRLARTTSHTITARITVYRSAIDASNMPEILTNAKNDAHSTFFMEGVGIPNIV